MRRVLAVALAVFLLFGTVAFGGSSGVSADTVTKQVNDGAGETIIETSFGSGPVHIKIRSFTNEVPNLIKEFVYSKPDFASKYTIDVNITPTANGLYQSQLDKALRDGDVDIYAAEAAFALKYSQEDMSQYAASYKDLGIDVDSEAKEAEIVQYSIDVGTRPNDGNVVALGYQSTAGAMIYRASIAKEVFGTDDPADIEKEFGGGTGNYDAFFSAAEKLKAKGYPVISDEGALWHMVEYSSSYGWINDGKLTVSPERLAFFDYVKRLVDNGMFNETAEWNTGWYNDMRGISQQGKDNKPAFCFFGPAWFINTAMLPNCGGTSAGEGTYGDWRVCTPPSGFFWGGTWIFASMNAANSDEKKQGVTDLIRWITLDTSEDGLQFKLAYGLLNGTKDTVASAKVMSIVNGSSDFLGGQDMYPVYSKAIGNTSGKNVTLYDDIINATFRAEVNLYAHNQKSYDAAIAAFVKTITETYNIKAGDIPERKPDTSKSPYEEPARGRDKKDKDSSEEQNGSMLMIIIIAAAVGVVLIAGVIVIIVVVSVSKKKKKALKAAQQNQIPQNPEPVQYPVQTPPPAPAPYPVQTPPPAPAPVQAPMPAPYPNPTYCPGCGSMQAPGSKFCDKCGCKLQ